MMSQIESELKQSFAKCDFIEAQKAFRCERVFGGRRRATFFFAETEVPPTRERIEAITTDLVSPSFFQAQDSARWSHYLVFVAPDSIRDSAGFRNTKRILEADRAYSRKFLICESELKNFLDHSVTEASSQTPSSDLLSTWMTILGEHGLTDVATAGPRAPVVRSVQFGTNQSGSGPNVLQSAPPEQPVQEPANTRFMERLSIQRFGARKLCGNYSFGTINLIRGPNGSGKTSLLESIEHFICGATLRSSGISEPFEATASFPNRPSVPFRPLTSKQAQDKDVRWYGRTFSKGNHLPEGFARYNFLNTDAAVDFSNNEDLKDLQTALSKISLGPQVSFVWDRLEQFEQDFSNAVSPLTSAIGRLNSSLLIARSRLEALSQPSPLLASQVRRFTIEATELGVVFTDPPSLAINEEWLAQFSPFRDVATRLKAFASYSSISEVGKRRDSIAADEKSVRSLIFRTNTISANRAQQSRTLLDLAANKALLNAAMKFVKSNVPQLLQAQREAVADSESLLAPPITASELELLSQLPGSSPTASAAQVRSFVQNEQQSLRLAMVRAEESLEKLQSKASVSSSLFSEMRALAEQFAKLHPDLSSCPVCRTSMDHAEFVGRLASVNMQNDVSQLQEAHSEHQRIAMSLSFAEECGRVLDRAVSWHPRSGEARIDDFKVHLTEVLRTIDEVQSRGASIAASLSSIEMAGLSIDEFSRLEAEIREKGFQPFPATSDEGGIMSALESVSALETQAYAVTQELDQELERTKGELAALANKYSEDSHGNLAARITQDLDATLDFLGSFEKLPIGSRHALEENLAAKSAAVEALAKLLAELNLEFRSERAKSSDLALISEQITREELEHGRLTKEHERLDSALRAIRKIREDHSLEAGMSEFLKSNLGSIQRIFERIHLPKELIVSSLANCSLERSGQAGLVQLNQISTGQRAALVLSIFFTLNLSLKNGPPMMLIDDPVAHVDDLNTLSFLDFVADIAESGRRQVFFATASEKLANLFEKKMEFLGAGFKVIDLRIA